MLQRRAGLHLTLYTGTRGGAVAGLRDVRRRQVRGRQNAEAGTPLWLGRRHKGGRAFTQVNTARLTVSSRHQSGGQEGICGPGLPGRGGAWRRGRTVLAKARLAGVLHRTREDDRLVKVKMGLCRGKILA